MWKLIYETQKSRIFFSCSNCPSTSPPLLFPSTPTPSQLSSVSAVIEQFLFSLKSSVWCSGNCIRPEHSGSGEVFPLERFKAFISLLSTSFCYLHHRTASENWKMHFLWRPSLMHCIVNLFIVSLQSAWWIRKEVCPNWLLFVRRSKGQKEKKLWLIRNCFEPFVIRIQIQDSTELTGSLLLLLFVNDVA